MSNARLDYPATGRNRDPILSILRELLPTEARVLEIASGSGQHAAYFAQALPNLRWQPSDIDEEVFASIRAWSDALENVLEPVRIDTTSPSWFSDAGVGEQDAIYCANMIHIAPWEAGLGLLAGAGRLLASNGQLILYGPFMRQGVHTAPSNAAFHQSLEARNPTWGVRDLDVVAVEAGRQGLTLDRVVEMPANNLTVVFRRG